jgi:hypothetical protein
VLDETRVSATYQNDRTIWIEKIRRMEEDHLIQVDHSSDPSLKAGLSKFIPWTETDESNKQSTICFEQN